ncbi:hypothetical protein [Fontivita pretiosa]|uniref:hypothetical protein n=1 Tax=Fontivita pretiosa TaxID=2989684 RepID=UPI003D18201E
MKSVDLCRFIVVMACLGSVGLAASVQAQWNRSDRQRDRWDRNDRVSRNADAEAAPSTSPAAPYSYRERYGVLWERNIFLRERGRRERVDRDFRPAAPRLPEQSLVVTGIVFEDGEYRAYIEDVSRGTTLKLSVGDAVARGKVVGIEIDAVAYENYAGVTWIPIGSNLAGASVTSVSDARIAAAAAGYAATTQPSAGGAGAAINASGANLSIEERLRLRRMQELGAAAAPAPPNPPQQAPEQQQPGPQQPGQEQPGQEQPGQEQPGQDQPMQEPPPQFVPQEQPAPPMPQQWPPQMPSQPPPLPPPQQMQEP